MISARTKENKTLSASNEHLNTLMALGLKPNQSKVYLASIQNGSVSIKKISEKAKIARPHVYQILTELEELGLIELSLEKPIIITPVGIQDAVSTLVNNKKHELKNITKSAKELLQHYEKFHNNDFNIITKNVFVWISKEKPYLRKRKEEIESAKKSIKIITAWHRFPLNMYNYAEMVKKALENKVIVQFILEKPPIDYSLLSMMHDLIKYPNFQIRQTNEPPHAIVAIFDKKTSIIDTNSEVGLAKAPALWTDNPCLTSVLLDYFEILWKNSKKVNTKLEKPIQS